MNKQEAIDKLRTMVKPGEEVRTILRHVTRSGMSRSVSVVLNGEDCSGLVALAVGMPFDRNHDGVKVGGCGMDVGFHLVYELSRTLYPEYRCTGRDGYGRDHCPSNEHVNPPRPKPDGKRTHRDGYALQQRWL